MAFWIAFAELLLCWTLWLLVFIVRHRRAGGDKAVVTAPSARWGILLQAIATALAWSYIRPDQGFKKPLAALIAAMILGPASVLLAFFAVQHLGKQWRIEAALSENHDLVQTGPYGWIRHPVYASMLGMLLATGLVWTWWPMLAAAVVLFVVGTEIRVRAEDRLLAGRFNDSFVAYRGRVRAYIPFLR